MPFTLNQALEQVRRELGDTDAANARWSADDLEQHLRHALEAVSLVLPREERAELLTTAGSREVSIQMLADRIAVEAVEYPAGNYPATYTGFSVWGDTLSLLVDATPDDGERVLVYWRALHTIDLAGSTVPPWAEHLVVQGAAGYAALEWASLAANRVNVGGEETWRRYLEWGKERLEAFHQGLDGVRRRRGLQRHQLYVPATGRPGQSTDGGP